MAISDSAVRHLMSAVAGRALGNQVADAVNQAVASTHIIAGAIVATATSTTIDFGSLAIGDRVLVMPAAAGNSQHLLVTVKGTLPQAAAVGSLYIVMRAVEAASSVKY